MADLRADQKRLAQLRYLAEAQRDRQAGDVPDIWPEDARELVHELQTYQIELEMQNEELRRTQEDLIESRDRYSDLYEFAPVGYVTAGPDGLIIETNLTLVEMLGFGRTALLGHALSAFIAPDDQDILYRHRRASLESKQRQACQVRMLRKHDDPLWVELDSIIVESDIGTGAGLRTAVIDIGARKRAEESLAVQATHDALTGLVNRSEFERRLQRLVDTASPMRRHALFYMDLDQFKVINDTCGHGAGDELLRQLGQMLPAVMRNGDTLARLGGDEFGLLMEDCTLPEALRLANTIRRAVSEFRFAWEESAFRIGVSIGVVPITQKAESLSYLLSTADSACYAAKDGGRNRVHVYHPDDSDLVRRQGEMQWVRRIDHALEEDRLQLWSQPIVPVTAESAEGECLEVLLRLVDEQGEIRFPADFLPAAERYGLATRIDRWVIGATLGWLSDNPRRLDGLELCFVNLSGSSLMDEEFLQFVQQTLEASRVPAHKICFEITETAVMSSLSAALSFMKSLRELGCLFALDDFGSGLSSYAYLKTLPVEYLKIDGAFVRDIVHDEVDLAFVRSISDVGRVMGKRTIAESVESPEILDKLRTVGVDYLQGYSVGRPAPIERQTASGIGG